MRPHKILLPASLALAAALTGGPAMAAVLPPSNPAANVPFNRSATPCQTTGTSTPDSSSGCIAADLAQIDAARAREGIGPMYLPNGYAQLSGPEQLFVVVNLERVDRGLPPFTALTSALDSEAAQGAGHGADPPLPSSGVTWAGGVWAGGFPSTLEADFGWMYDDGPGSDNLDCTSPTAPGCWGHRDLILYTGHNGDLVAGAADGLGSWGPEYAMVLTDSVGTPTVTAYQWQQAVAQGAGASPQRLVTLPPATRLAGADRIGTAIAVSQATWSALGSSGRHPSSAVIARSDAFPDALASVPLAAAKDGPLLLSGSSALDPRTLTELQRILAPGSTVYVVGGASALAPTVDAAVLLAGFVPDRLAGTDRFSTATAIAQALGNPSTVLEADGMGFADALSAGPAAAMHHAAVLLTNGSDQSAATAAYLAANHPTAYAVGGPASAADPVAKRVAGSDRYDTAAQVASLFFNKPSVVGFATGSDFPDALAAGAQLGVAGAPLLLVSPTSLPDATVNYLDANVPSATVIYGGVSAISPTVAALL